MLQDNFRLAGCMNVSIKENLFDIFQILKNGAQQMGPHQFAGGSTVLGNSLMCFSQQ